MIPLPVQKSFEREPYQFGFVQLIRLLYLYQDDDRDLNQKLVGYENAPADEAVRFKVSPGMRHHSSDVRKIQVMENGQHAVEVSFLGLIGGAGVMPHHYSQMVLDRIKANDEAMKDYFDLFHHRIISNFFRSSVKYRLPFQHELFSRFKPASNGGLSSRTFEKDAISRAMSCTVGMGEVSIQNRMDIDDRIVLHYGGHFSHSRPTLLGLTRMLGEFCRQAVKILQFQFEWLYLDLADQTNLSGPVKRLGQDVVIGSRVGSIQNRFRVQLGPLSWQEFSELLPNRKRLQEIAQLTRAYVGIGLDFDFQLVIQGAEVPCAQLGNDACGRLGWNTWITGSKMTGLIEDAVFAVENIDDKFGQQ